VTVPCHGRRRLAAASIAFVLLAAACGSQVPSVRPPSASAPPPSAAVATPSVAAAASTGPSGALPSTLIAIDSGLLGLLPTEVDGHPLIDAPDAAVEPASDAALAASAQSLAVALAVDEATGSFLVASIVKLRPGVYNDEFFRQWRDSFDEGVCGQAGGVTGKAEATFGARTAYIGSCEGGVHTYHVHLDGPDAILSLNAVGDGRLGEQLLQTLPP
jgi:hypothetical protein